MKINDFFYEIITSIWRHKLRNLLTITGVIWGSYAIFMLLAIGEGIYVLNAKQLQVISAPIAYVVLNTTTQPYQGLTPGRQLAMIPSQMLQLKNALPDIEQISPFFGSDQDILVNGQSNTINVSAIAPSYFAINHIEYVGRLLNEEDITLKRRVAFLTYQAKERLFGEENALGKTFFVNNINFRVIGYGKKSQATLRQIFFNLFIPYTTAALSTDNREGSVFLVRLKNNQNIDAFKNTLRNYLAKRLHFAAQDKAALSIWTFTSLATTMSNLLLAVRLFLGFCGIMTLMVGGISVANMMYLLIQERIHEIGLRMALGAQPKLILWRFMAESFILIAGGGILGAGLSYLTLAGLRWVNLPGWLGTPQLNEILVLTVIIILLIIALIAGLPPARKAATKVPIEALRF